MKSIFNTLSKVIGNPTNIHGIRQHRLMITNPDTFYNQITVGLKYDTSLVFAEHEGFRNSYCYPFRIYDFKKEEMLDIWEIPLTLMDVSVLEYQKLSNTEILKSIGSLINEAKRFNGLFSLLWHNCRLNEAEYKDIKPLYEACIQLVVDNKAISMTGKEIINHIKSSS